MRTLVFSALLALCSVVHAGAREQFDHFVSQTQTLSADFTQTASGNGKVQTAHGTMQLARPNRFRWEYLQPEPQLIVGDGKQIWIYDSDLKQVSVKSQKAALGDSPAALLAGTSEVDHFYTLTEGGSKNGLDWLNADAKAKDQGYAQVRMGFAGGELKVMELTDFTGQLTHIEFSSLKKNPALNKDVFTFTPPAGVDVLRD